MKLAIFVLSETIRDLQSFLHRSDITHDEARKIQAEIEELRLAAKILAGASIALPKDISADDVDAIIQAKYAGALARV